MKLQTSLEEVSSMTLVASSRKIVETTLKIMCTRLERTSRVLGQCRKVVCS